MIVGKITDGRIVIGLCWENLDRLQKGQPIHMTKETHKVENDIFIFCSPTQGDLMTDLAKFVELPKDGRT